MDKTYECFPLDNKYPATAQTTIKLSPVTNDGIVNKVTNITPRIMFGNQPDGLLGDEDNGAMSSWYLFSSMGLFPVPGTDQLIIGSPIFTSVTINIG